MYKATQVTVTSASYNKIVGFLPSMKATTALLAAFEQMDCIGGVSMDVKIFGSESDYHTARKSNEWDSLSYPIHDNWRHVQENLRNNGSFTGSAFDVWCKYEGDLERVPEDCRPKEEEN